MELKHDFRVAVPVEQAWEVLTDLERIAPCMPGAQLKEVEGDEYRGIVKVKVGPITAQYRGTARFTELDSGARRAVLRAEGRDTRGQGTAAATVIASLAGDGSGTAVQIETDLDISGKVAQFGRGMLAEVSEKLLGQFVQQLEKNVLSGPGGDAENPPGAQGEATATEAPDQPKPATSAGSQDGPDDATGRRTIEAPPAEPVDVLQAAGGSVLKRLAPVAVGAVLIVGALALRRARRHHRG